MRELNLKKKKNLIILSYTIIILLYVTIGIVNLLFERIR